MLQAITLGSAAACEPERDAAARGSAPAAEHAAHDGGHEHGAPAGHEQQHDRSGGKSHCAMAMSCALFGAADAEVVHLDDMGVATEGIGARDLSVPRSIGQAPDTPPPRG